MFVADHDFFFILCDSVAFLTESSWLVFHAGRVPAVVLNVPYFPDFPEFYVLKLIIQMFGLAGFVSHTDINPANSYRFA